MSLKWKSSNDRAAFNASMGKTRTRKDVAVGGNEWFPDEDAIVESVAHLPFKDVGPSLVNMLSRHTKSEIRARHAALKK